MQTSWVVLLDGTTEYEVGQYFGLNFLCYSNGLLTDAGFMPTVTIKQTSTNTTLTAVVTRIGTGQYTAAASLTQSPGTWVYSVIASMIGQASGVFRVVDPLS